MKNHIKTLIYLQHWIYYNQKIDDYEDIYSANHLYLTITHASGYTEKKGINKYLIFDSIDENKDKNIKIFDSIDKNIMMFLMKLEAKSKK